MMREMTEIGRGVVLDLALAEFRPKAKKPVKRAKADPVKATVLHGKSVDGTKSTL